MRMPPPIALTGDPEERNYKSDKFVFCTQTSISLWHDYICPWCFVGFHQAMRLTKEFGVTFDWRGAELLPPGMAYTPHPPPPLDPNAPSAPPSRFDRFAQSEGLVPPSPRPAFVRSHRALLGQEFALRTGDYDTVVAYNEAVYRAFWERREDISDIQVLTPLAEAAGMDGTAFAQAVEAEQDVDNIVPFDDDAYANGIRHVPLFLFGGEELLTEAPYASLAAATESFLVRREKFQGK